MIEERDRYWLLRLARESIRRHLESRDLPPVEDVQAPFTELRGVFVSLRRTGTLRGCIGLVERSTPLWEGVRSMAVAAATRDSRFDPVRLEELDEIDIEISILSDLERVGGPEAIQIGRHGIYLKKESRSGLLLPQVATEYEWEPIQFLERTSQKAGLPPEGWREGAEIFVFSCDCFDDLAPGLREP